MDPVKTKRPSILPTISHDQVIKIKPDDSNKATGCCSKHGCLRQNLLALLTLFAVIVGIGVGIGLRQLKTWSKREAMYVSFPGEIFIRMLRCLILPLIFSSLVSALGSLDMKLSGKIGLRAVGYYLVTTLLAIALGIMLVTTIKPGSANDDQKPVPTVKEKSMRPNLPADTLMDLVRNLFPPNILEACVAQTSTVLIPPMSNDSSAKNITDIHFWDFKTKMGGDTNILGLVIFAVVLGITLGRMKEDGKPLLTVFVCLSDAIMIITKLVIWLSPIGVLFLVAGKIIEIEDIGVIAGLVGMYTVTVIAGLFLHATITLPLLFFIFVRKQPFIFLANMGQAIATAFGTSSSSATLPVTITCLEERNKIDPRVSRFCLPVGATVNMDGAALYEAVAAIFIAQLRNVPMNAGSIINMSIAATAASIGAAGIPQAGFVTTVMVFNVVGLPLDDVAFVYVMDWLVDRCRTVVNVLGDAIGAGIVAHLSAKDLEALPIEDKVVTANGQVTSL